MRLSFPKTKRLVTNRQFRSVLANKVSARDKLLIVYVTKNDCGHPRLGLSVSKKCGNAVARNRIKRLIREAFRTSQNNIPQNLDYLLMALPKYFEKNPKAAAKGLNLQLISDSLAALIAKVAGKIT